VARVEPRSVDFGAGSEVRTEVVESMTALVTELDGWVTFEPLFDEESLPPVRASWLDIFSGRGPVVPDARWVPGERKGEKVTPLSVGLRHPSGGRAVARLVEAGHPVPEGWRMVQDHPKRGLVLEARPGVDVDADATLDWMFDALAALTPLPLTGLWRATFHARH
jgi:hypothetical protein